MRYRSLLAVILFILPGVAQNAAAQTYIGTATAIGTQWQAQQGNLASFIAQGFGIVAVTQQLTQSDRGIVNLTSYFLQNEKSFVRCNELTVPTISPPVSRKGKPARGAQKPPAPTVILGCAKAIAPAEVPLSDKAGGIEAILSGR